MILYDMFFNCNIYILYIFIYYSDLIVIDFITLCIICCWLYDSHQTAGAVGHAGGARPGSLAKGASRTPFRLSDAEETYGMIGECLMI